MAMETRTSYGMLRSLCDGRAAAERILSMLEDELTRRPFDFGFLEYGDADSSTCYMAGLCDALVATLDDNVFDDKVTIMGTLMHAFWGE